VPDTGRKSTDFEFHAKVRSENLEARAAAGESLSADEAALLRLARLATERDESQKDAESIRVVMSEALTKKLRWAIASVYRALRGQLKHTQTAKLGEGRIRLAHSRMQYKKYVYIPSQVDAPTATLGCSSV
jgi:hypothetical protein